MSEILVSKLITPDGTILKSRHTHDYTEHIDATNGKIYMLDGGTSYTRCSVHDDQKLITITTDDPHSLVRKHFEWGTYGKEGRFEDFKWVLLKAMSNLHIQNVLGCNLVSKIRAVFENEIKYRKERNLVIED